MKKILRLVFLGHRIGKLVAKPVSRVVVGYADGVWRQFFFAVFLPIPFIVFATTAGQGWLWINACAGLWSAFYFVRFFILLSPVGIPAVHFMRKKETLTEGQTATRSRDLYANLAIGVLLWQTLASLFLSIVPVRNNPSALPLFLLVLLFLVLLGLYQVKNKWIGTPLFVLALVVAFVNLVSFYNPKVTADERGVNWVASNTASAVTNIVSGAKSATKAVGSWASRTASSTTATQTAPSTPIQRGERLLNPGMNRFEVREGANVFTLTSADQVAWVNMPAYRANQDIQLEEGCVMVTGKSFDNPVVYRTPGRLGPFGTNDWLKFTSADPTRPAKVVIELTRVW
ncbi:MAG: hypothetical protein ABI430_02465 [Candidatus Taylorbacteria bacterium]